MVWTEQYLHIVRQLDINITKDARATKVMDRLVKPQNLTVLSDIIQGKPVLIFGCGPSLENDLHKITASGIHKKCVIVAADGAVKALMEYNILPQINVTDLDGDLHSIIKANRRGTISVVHAHGDNILLLPKIMPYLTGAVIATTQHDPTEKVHNFGGFTDGDRACYLVERFKPRLIALAGMDFGKIIGIFSGHYDPVRKPRKLRIGKELVEDLASKSHVKFFNLTSSGEHIKGVEAADVAKITYFF